MKFKTPNYLKFACVGLIGLAFAHAVSAAITIPVGDGSFEDSPVPVAGYAYWNGLPNSAWSSDGNWWYNGSYDSGRRPTPRTGLQAIHGSGSYNWQTAGVTFEAETTYRLSLWTQGDSDAAGLSDTIWLYIYDASAGRPANFDADSLLGVQFDQNGNTAVPSNVGGQGGIVDFTGFNRGGDANWTQVSIDYTVNTGDAAVGTPIGIGFYGAVDAAIDDVSFEIIPEPSSVLLLGVGGAAGLLRRRRRW